MLIFQYSQPQRRAHAQCLPVAGKLTDIPQRFLRTTTPQLPEVSELQVVRHYTNLSRKNFSIDTHFYPLGSCTMKYNPRAAHQLASLSQFLARHPLTDVQHSQGYMACAYELQHILTQLTGMQGVSLAPMAGGQGEFAGVAMIRAYHEARGDNRRKELLVPDAAHGTNPASAVMCGYKVKEIPTTSEGDIDLQILSAVVGPQTAGVMLTNPSTLGLFERKIEQIAAIMHQVGGLLYYDGANLNAILGQCRPGDMGFDVMHINLHKTFATPHGSGGPGAGPIAFSERLAPFAPMPMVARREASYVWLTEQDNPQSIGRLSNFMGNAGVILRAWVYARLLGREGLKRVSQYATLNANYMMHRLQQAGFKLAYPKRRAAHEFIISLLPQAKAHGVNAMDFAKRLLDYGFHPPTIYFPLSIPECLLIEPTETESKQQIDAFIEAMIEIKKELETDPQWVKSAPHRQNLSRLDEVKAARELNIKFTP